MGSLQPLQEPNMSLQILRLLAVMSLTGLGRSTIYAKIAEEKFPKPIHLGTRSVGWLEDDIKGWLSERVRESRPDVGAER